jgi:hypothetical protein
LIASSSVTASTTTSQWVSSARSVTTDAVSPTFASAVSADASLRAHTTTS